MHDASKEGITLVRLERSYEWNAEEGGYVVHHETGLTTAMEKFFEGATEDVKKYNISHLVEYLSMDMEALSEAYSCIYFDCDDERRWKGGILDGLKLSIEFNLHSNDLVLAKVDESRMLSHSSELKLDTEQRDDRIRYLSRYIEVNATDSCDLVLDMIKQLLSPDSDPDEESARFTFVTI